MKNVVVLGANGMLGHMLCDVLSEKYCVFPLTRKDVDLQDFNRLIQTLDSINLTAGISAIVNCAGILVEKSKDNPEMARIINGELPIVLGKYSQNKNIHFIHISSDCVFSGKRGSYYTLDDIPDASDVYGVTKALGETVAYNYPSTVIRTSIIGPELKQDGTGLFDWYLTSNRGSVYGFKNHLWNGVTTLELSSFISSYVLQHPKMYGLYHFVGESTSKYRLLKQIQKIWNTNIEVTPLRSKPIDRRLYPEYFQVPKQSKMLKDLYDYMNNHKKDLYAHYNRRYYV